MSYSRWSKTSYWYTYGSSNENKEEIFEICTEATFTRKELEEDINGCIDKLKNHISKESEIRKRMPTEKDWKLLKKYMNEFLEDEE